MPPLRIQENMRPTLDSDVVEKVAVWNKHVGAVAEGIAISSVARSRPFYAPDTPHYPHHEQQQQQQQQQQHDLGLEVETAIDERIAIEQVTRDCVQRCIVEEDLFLDEFGIKCAKADNSDKCYKTRCTNGCAQWYRALKEIEPCQEACVSTQFYPFDMPCIGACEMAQRQYWHLQRLAMTQLVETTQPQLVEMTGESATLTIRWDMQFPENYLASRPFNIQYQQQNEEQKLEQESPWHNMADYNCDEYYVCEIVEALMPYTRYKFRFELPFGESSEDVLYSPTTPIYQTPMAGAPISAPIITTLLSLDEEHVGVHWRPGRYTNAPLQGYHIRLRSDASNASSSNREELLPASRGSFIFAELHPLTNYTVELTMINKQGKGPPALASIQTKAPLSPEQLRSVLLASERSISWQSLEPAGESRVIFSAEADATINDMVYSERQQQLWVLDSLGRLYRQQLEEDTSRQLLQLQLNSSEWRPRRLSLDWLQHRLYLAVEDPTQQHQLFSCSQDGDDVQQLVKTALGTKVQQLELDAVNGWLFWSDAQAIWRLDLHSKQRLQLHQAQQLGHFMLLPQRWLLQLLQQEDQLLELSYDGSHKRQLEQLPSAQLAATFALSSDKRQLLVANATQLQLLERHTLNVIASWPLSAEQELLVQLTPLERRRQPLALEATTPRELRALLGAQAAQISWQEPALNPYQAVSSNCSYELEVLDVASQSAYNIRNIRSPHFGLERLQPDNLYQLRVRAINAAGQAGEWTSALLSRTWPRGEHRLRWATQRGDLYVTNELGAQLEMLPARLEPMSLGPLSLLNASIAYYVSNGTLRCINLLQPQLSCQAPPQTQHVGAVAYDWRGGLLYWTDLERDCVQRLDPQSGSRELLPIFGARHLALDPEQGHLYYASTAHLARRPMSAQDTQQPELEYYHVSGLAGQINGFSLDLQQRYIYWLVGGSSVQAELHLYRSSLSLASGSQAPEMIQLPPGASAVPHTLQFLQPLNALLWLQGKQASSAQLLRMSEQLESEHLRPQELSEPLSAVQLLPSFALSAPDPGVRPLAVPPDSIRIDEGGHWDDFRLRWQTAASGGNHSICYKLLLEHGSERVLTLELATPFARITQLSHAPQQLRVSITPHTSWRAGPTSSVQLSTPVAAPTQPRRLRVFVERHAVPLQLEPNVSALLRWDVPEEEHGLGSQALQYRISCWQGSELHTELLLNQSTLEARIEQLQPDVTYRFQVQAHVAATGVAAGATSHALHVAPEVQSVPRLLYANAEHIGELDLDTATRRQLVHTASPVEHLALMQGEQRLLWVNEHVELLSHVPGSAPAKLARMRAEVLALTVDWVQRIVYWAELDASTQPPAACIYRLDLCRFEGRILQGERMWSTPPGQLLHDLVALPHARSLVWLQHELGARNATLEGRSLANGSALSFESVPGPLWRLFEGSQEPQSETLNLVDHQGRLCVYHVARQLCMPTALRSQLNLLSDDIAQLAQDAGYIYALRNGSVRGYSRRRQQLAYVLDLQPDEVRLLRAHNYQAYPSRRCLLLPTLGTIETPMCEETHCQLHLPALTAASDCPLPVPGLEYQLQLSSAHAQLRQLHALAGEQLNITGLQPYRAYELRVRISSYYQQRLGLEALQLAPLELQTAAATPSAPRNFTGRALSPSELELSWAAPLELRSDSVYYVLHWLLEDQPLEQALEQPLVQEQRVETAGTQRLTGLQPGRVYQVWVQAHATPGKFNRSESLFLRCYAPLPPLQLEELHAYGMTLSWFGTPDVLSTLALECQSLREHLHLNVLGNHTTMRLESLQPKTRYSCRLALNYAASPGAPVYYGASQDYETLGDAPSAPGRPQIEHIAGEIFRVSWTPAEEHGDPILLYNMEALQARRGSRRRRRRDTAAQLLPWAEEPTVLEDQWLDFCNTTELSCLVRDLYSRRLFLFRVRARNRPHGWGPYSEESDRIAEPFVSPEKRGSLVLAIIAPAAIVSSCVLALILVRKVQKRRHRAKKLLQQSRPSIWSNLSALQTQQQLLAARNRTFSMTLSDADIALLPQISWNRLTLLRFLGSGAFGEVYEGQLQGEDEAQPQRVAIKSLRKGASEFAELLQEAQLMSNFKHENIVCLIGICFDSESISLIMEHMEAGDLLSYLRAARPNSQEQLPGQTETQSTTTTPTPTPQLQLPDLLAMCLDVANGCSYLEDMHFVHRDLACRNCLVSNGAAVGGRRIVKIGDFGLARDIYKSDYYRKEGEGLLPVRWMALESLVDGIFSTQSDVWAFGVLCWEILTLGQQPYAARNNFEVLAHVKDGGRLQPPDECPEKLYALLLQCWRCEPWERPSFRRCYNTLQSINSELHSPSSNVSVPKPEARVHFDETTEHQSTKENTTPANSVSSSTKKTVADNRQQQLYANEGVSRL